MEKLSLCLSSQTPLVRFNIEYQDTLAKHGASGQLINLEQLVEGEIYQFTAGGVTRMVFPLLKRMIEEGSLANPNWISLNPFGPEKIMVGGITLHHVRLDKERMKGYGQAKEAIWKAVHGIPEENLPVDSLFWQDEYADYTYYNRLFSELVLKLDQENNFDLFYMHDFQQLPMAHMLNNFKPKIFRWHIPFNESLIPETWRPSLSSYFNAYDIVVVSCKRYLDSLKNFGYKGDARYIYPYIDQTAYKKPPESEISKFNEKFGLKDEDRVLLVVARLDPMKGQDRAVKALANLRNFPNLKLVLAGNGSFSSSKQGIGLSKAELWLSRLRELVVEMKVENRVVFTGHLTHAELQAAYERAELTILPSVLEGFGLVVIESWLYKKPTIVSSAAGVAEIINHGENGLLFNPGDPKDLADKIATALSNENLLLSLGDNGYNTSHQYSLEQGTKSEVELMIDLVGAGV